MATPDSFSEEECFNVYWKIKNFSFFLDDIVTPEFRFSGDQYTLRLNSNSSDIFFRFSRKSKNSEIAAKTKISLNTIDGSPEKSVSVENQMSFLVPKDIIFRSRRTVFLPEDTLTFQFQSPTITERRKVFIESLIGVKRKIFVWTFKDFSTFQSYAMKTVESSESYGIIELNFKPMGGNNPGEQFSIEISRSHCTEKCYCVLKIYILDVDGKAVNEVSDEFVFDKNNGSQMKRGFPLIIKKTKLLSCKNLLLPNDTLSLKCDFAISLGKVVNETAVTNYCEDVTNLLKETDDTSMTYKKNYSCCVTELQNDLKSILEAGTLHDASLQVGFEVVQVHKSILSARSPVFKAMFTKDMKEAINNKVDIEDFDIDTIRRLLLYMYTDTIHDEQWENMKKLYSAAEKYEVLGLKKKCISFMKTNLSISNVSEALVIVDLYQDEDLKTAAIDFISKYDSEVFASDAWKELEKKNSPFALKIMREIYLNIRIRLN